MERKPIDNPTTFGMDGADRAEWHTPQSEITGGDVLAACLAVCALLTVAGVALSLWAVFA